MAEVVRVFSTADLSDVVLFDADADPFRLASSVRAKMPPYGLESQLGEAGARLFDVILDECCECLVRILLQLPQFGPRASAETLARLSGLAGQVQAVLDQMPPRSLDAPRGTADDEEFRRRYLHHVSQVLDSVELFGVQVERYHPQATLSVAYISLTVSAQGPGSSGTRGRSALHALRVADWREGDRQGELAAVRVEVALGRSRLTLIRGEAGSGKSTLLCWLAVAAARGKFTADLAGWNGCVPFYITLRSYAGRTLPNPEEFLATAAGPIAGLMPEGWVHRQMSSGRALLMVDGVDELTGQQRHAVRPWLAGLLADYPEIRVVVTSRPAAAGSDWLAAEGFTEAFLERMRSADIRALIRHWHAAVKDAGNYPCTPEELPAYEAALMSRLEAAPHLWVLAATPLLAAMLCALNLDRKTQLPHDRMDLYRAALDMLVERRDAERHVPSYQDVVLEQGQKMQILQRLAWRLSATGRAELPKPTALACVEETVRAMPRVTAGSQEVLEYLLQRSGVLREPSRGRIDFIHRTIQEYLTARQVADDGDMDLLVRNAHRDQWREIIVMAAGRANAPQRRELLAGLLQRMRAEQRYTRQLMLLVASCQETLAAVPDEFRGDIDACLKQLVPPRDLVSARSLARRRRRDDPGPAPPGTAGSSRYRRPRHHTNGVDDQRPPGSRRPRQVRHRRPARGTARAD